MNRKLPLLKILVLGGPAAALAILFFPFVIPGMLLSRVVRSPHERWILPLSALLIVLTWRMIFGTWVVRIGGDSSEERIVGLMQLVASWAVGVIFVRAGFRMARCFLEMAALQPAAR